MTRDDLRRQLADLIASSTDGDVPPAASLAGGVPLTALGVTSLATLRLVDALEARYGVALDPADVVILDSVDRLADHLAGSGVRVDGG